MIIFLDILILFNIMIDYSILVVVGSIQKKKMHILRLVLASLLGASSLLLIFVENQLVYLVLKLLFSLIIVRVAFKYSNFKNLLLDMIVFYLVNFVIAGVILSLNLSTWDTNKLLNTKTITITTVVIAFLFANILLFIFREKMFYLNLIKKSSYEVKFTIMKKKFHLDGFIDTGNMVEVRGTPVVFLVDEYISKNMTNKYILDDDILTKKILINQFGNELETNAILVDDFYIKQNNKWNCKPVYLATVPQIFEGETQHKLILHSKLLTGEN